MGNGKRVVAREGIFYNPAIAMEIRHMIVATEVISDDELHIKLPPLFKLTGEEITLLKRRRPELALRLNIIPLFH